MKEKTLEQINMNMNANLSLIRKDFEKKDELMTSEIKFSHICLCGILGNFIGMFSVMNSSADSILLAGMGGYVAGLMTPYVVRKIRIMDLDYQIYMNRSIVRDLEKEKRNALIKSKILRKYS